MIQNELQNIIQARFPRASQSFIKANSQLRAAQPQRESATTLVKAIPRAQKVRDRITLCYCFCRVRPLDLDNAYGATKNCTDALCRCGLLPGDDPTKITLQVVQKRVKKYSQEQTEIEIVYPQ
jgi:hypothetical protein